MRVHRCVLTLGLCGSALLAALTPSAAAPGARVVVDAHNCYPYLRGGRLAWAGRIERALAVGTPIAIEQDLAWYTDPATGRGRVVLSHAPRPTAADPALNEYFFASVRPLMEAALRRGNQGDWPLITLNLDLKSEQPELLRGIWALLQQHQEWLTTAPRTSDMAAMPPLRVGPMLVLTGASTRQEAAFYAQVPAGGRLLVFGAASPATPRADNYHRWVNYSWSAVETGGPGWAEALDRPWTAAKQRRLQALVTRAHAAGLWIRFYSLDGAGAALRRSRGWSRGYDFGSLAAVQTRWRAAAAAGVDYVASDQYEALAATLRAPGVATLNACPSPSATPSSAMPAALPSAAMPAACPASAPTSLPLSLSAR